MHTQNTAYAQKNQSQWPHQNTRIFYCRWHCQNSCADVGFQNVDHCLTISAKNIFFMLQLKKYVKVRSYEIGGWSSLVHRFSQFSLLAEFGTSTMFESFSLPEFLSAEVFLWRFFIYRNSKVFLFNLDTYLITGVNIGS